MTIKEALEQLKIKVENEPDDISAWKTIVEILEIKLSNVEKENQELKEENTDILNKFTMQNKVHLKLLEQKVQLEKENQELKKAYISVNEELHCAFARGVDSARFDVLEENQKLKKVIEILEKYLDVNIAPNKYGNYLIEATGIELITQQEYELLKKVLVDE